MSKNKIMQPFLAISRDKFTVDTIEELKTRREFRVGDVVELNGYYGQGDGANHKRKVEQVDDGSGVQLANGLWANIIHNGEVNVSWFGAKGDGVTNDANFIQKCFDFNCDVIFMKGNFLVDKELYLKSDTTVIGVNCVVEMKNSVKIARVFSNYRVENCKKIHIKSIDFKGYCSNETVHESGLVAIELVRVTDVNISNCTYDGFNKNIELTECKNSNCCQNTILNATETKNSTNGYGVLLEECGNTVIKENTINIERHGVYVNGCEDVWVEGNIITGQTNDLPRYSHYEGNIKINGSKNVYVQNNISKGNYYGIGLLKSFTSDLGGNNIFIENNTIIDCIDNPGFSCAHIVFFEGGNYSNIYIKNNTVTNTNSKPRVRGVMSDILGTNLENIFINSNRITGVETGIRIGVTGSVDVSRNFVESCDKGYDFSFSNLNIKADVLYHKNCRTPVFTAGLFSSGSSVTKIIDLSNTEQEITNGTVDANLNSRYYVSGLQQITKINNGFNGQIIKLWANGAGFLQIRKSFGLNFEITEDFISSEIYSEITFENRLGRWLEINRVLVKPVKISALNTPYHVLKMQEEGVYNDFISYMDKKNEYDNKKRADEENLQKAYKVWLESNPDGTYEEFVNLIPVNNNLILLPEGMENTNEEPQPSPALLAFKEKYLG